MDSCPHCGGFCNRGSPFSEVPLYNNNFNHIERPLVLSHVGAENNETHTLAHMCYVCTSTVDQENFTVKRNFTVKANCEN